MIERKRLEFGLYNYPTGKQTHDSAYVLALQVSTYCLLSFVHLQNSRLRRVCIEQTPVWQIPEVCAILQYAMLDQYMSVVGPTSSTSAQH